MQLRSSARDRPPRMQSMPAGAATNTNGGIQSSSRDGA